MTPKEMSNEYLVFRCLAGSHSYGTNIEGSDVDTRGVFIAPPSHVLSCINKVEQVESSEEDETLFELRKFMKLAAECNPNIIELLYTDECNVQYIDWPFKMLRDNRHLFLSKKARHTFSGYATSQLHRIKSHHKWIVNPQPVDPPHLKDYCRFIDDQGGVYTEGSSIAAFSKNYFLAETFGQVTFRVYSSPEFFKDKLGFFSEEGNQLRYCSVSDTVLFEKAEFEGMLMVDMERFKREHKLWKEYWHWKKNRNESRAELEEKFKFDTKHALHLVRLMRMCEEILTKGEVIVRRPDAKELLDIRNGKFDYEWLIKWADETDLRMNELYEKSTLQFAANYPAIDELYRQIVMRYWEEKGLI